MQHRNTPTRGHIHEGRKAQRVGRRRDGERGRKDDKGGQRRRRGSWEAGDCASQVAVERGGSFSVTLAERLSDLRPKSDTSYLPLGRAHGAETVACTACREHATLVPSSVATVHRTRHQDARKSIMHRPHRMWAWFFPRVGKMRVRCTISPLLTKPGRHARHKTDTGGGPTRQRIGPTAKANARPAAPWRRRRRHVP